MPTKKKTTRRYDSTRRKEQARQTRGLILNAARDLFNERGYSGATIEAIAAQAEVAPETIYATYKNKRGLLARLIEVTVSGDEQPLSLLGRPGPVEVLQAQDQAQMIELFTNDITQILVRVAPLFPILRTAARTEAEIAELLEALLANRRGNLAQFVRAFITLGTLRPGLDPEQATDLVWTLSSPDVFNLLTLDRGWSAERYSKWLSDALVRLLLP